MKSLLITTIVCLVVYEAFEHLVLPLFWVIRHRKKVSAYGPTGMIGKKCTVQQWHGTSGKVRVGAELWNANGSPSLHPGDEPVIQGIEGLTLQVAAPGSLTDGQEKRAGKDRQNDA